MRTTHQKPVFFKATLCFLWVLTFDLSAAEQKPVTQQEIATGTKQYKPNQQAQGGQYVVDKALGVYVNMVGQKLAKASESPNLPYEFVVINDNSMNAWALPGGKIAINRGLLVELRDEAQLAAVLSHEISHVTRRHSARMQKKSSGTSLLGALAGLAIGAKIPQLQDLAMQGSGLLTQGFQANYSRDYETQADNVGLALMAKAGYDAQAAVEIQELFLSKSQSNSSAGISAFFASHPPSKERIASNKARLVGMPSGGLRHKPEYEKAIARLQRDKPAYTLYQKAITEVSKNKNYKQALTYAEQAIALQPKENLFWEFKGIVLQRQKLNRESLVPLDKAVAANTEFFRPYIYRGMAYKELANWPQAESNLKSSMNLLATQFAAYHLGEVSLQLNNREQAIKNFQAAMQGGGELGQAAKQQLLRLQ
jgi:predicted Zn-dependent protease